MPLIEAALAFAITMLALSLVVSSFVEMIHRLLSMREKGLKYMLEQLFDQVLSKHLTTEQLAKLGDTSKLTADQKAMRDKVLEAARKAFAARMSANRAPMGVAPNATPDSRPEQASKRKGGVRLWNGRDLATMTPTEFMERLGSIDVGAEIIKTVTTTGQQAADALDNVFKDIAQKFEAFGKEASDYFEGRARLLSVIVAIVLAFLAHVDAVDLFKTYLRDPNARAKVIEQSDAVTAQHKAAAEAAKALEPILKSAPPETTEDIKKQIDALKDDMKTAITGAKATIKQYADLGAPIGWTDDRIDAVHPANLLWVCSAGDIKDAKKPWQTPCKQIGDVVWFAKPRVVLDWIYLLLGGLLIGLGSPFWYSAVSGLANIRNTARGATGGADVQSRARATDAEVKNAQPVTPVGTYQVSIAAADAAKKSDAARK